jgi:predicted transcriptional regulator
MEFHHAVLPQKIDRALLQSRIEKVISHTTKVRALSMEELYSSPLIHHLYLFRMPVFEEVEHLVHQGKIQREKRGGTFFYWNSQTNSNVVTGSPQRFLSTNKGAVNRDLILDVVSKHPNISTIGIAKRLTDQGYSPNSSTISSALTTSYKKGVLKRIGNRSLYFYTYIASPREIDNKRDKRTESLQDKLMAMLPKNKEDAICWIDIKRVLPKRPSEDLRKGRPDTQINSNLALLYRAHLCNRERRSIEGSKTHTRFYYWKGSSYKNTTMESIREFILTHLPKTKEHAITSLDFWQSSKRWSLSNFKTSLYILHGKGLVKYVGPRPYHYWCESKEASDRNNDTMDCVKQIEARGYKVALDAYSDLAALEKEYAQWVERSPTFIIPPNSISLAPGRFGEEGDWQPPEETIAISKSLSFILENLAVMGERQALELIADVGRCNGRKAKEILRIAKDETVMARIKEARVPEFTDSIFQVLFNMLEEIRPTSIRKPNFPQWRFPLHTVTQEVTRSNIKVKRESRLHKQIKYDEEATKRMNSGKKGYFTNPLQVASQKLEGGSLIPQQGILTRIKAIEANIAHMQKRYEEVNTIIQEKERGVQLLKLEQSEREEQIKLTELEERLKRWSDEEIKLKADLLK